MRIVFTANFAVIIVRSEQVKTNNRVKSKKKKRTKD